jgi:hypothetical protein
MKTKPISIYLKGCLFFCHVETFQTTTPLAMLLVPPENPWWIQVHEVGFIMFWPMVKKLLNIEQKIHNNYIKI